MKTLTVLLMFIMLCGMMVVQDVPPGYVKIGQVKASDPDRGQTLTYSITGEYIKEFNINAKTGMLSVNKEFYNSFKEEKKFTFTVTVTDNGIPVKATKATITVIIHKKTNGNTSPSVDVIIGK